MPEDDIPTVESVKKRYLEGKDATPTLAAEDAPVTLEAPETKARQLTPPVPIPGAPRVDNIRNDGTLKGTGFYGNVSSVPGTEMTELSVGVDGKDVPLINPDMSGNALRRIGSGGMIMPGDVRTAVGSADTRAASGLPSNRTMAEPYLPMPNETSPELESHTPADQPSWFQRTFGDKGATTSRQLAERGGISNALATLAASVGGAGSPHATWGGRLGAGVLNMNEQNVKNLEGIEHGEREQAHLGLEGRRVGLAEEHLGLAKKQEGRLERAEQERLELKKKVDLGEKRLLETIDATDPATGLNPLEAHYGGDKQKAAIARAAIEAGDKKVIDQIFKDKELIPVGANGLLDPKTGTIYGGKPGKTIETHIDAGNRVIIQYTDGTTETITKGAAPKAEKTTKESAKNITEEKSSFDSMLTSHLELQADPKLHQLDSQPVAIQELRAEAKSRIGNGESAKDVWDDIKGRIPQDVTEPQPKEGAVKRFLKYGPFHMNDPEHMGKRQVAAPPAESATPSAKAVTAPKGKDAPEVAEFKAVATNPEALKVKIQEYAKTHTREETAAMLRKAGVGQ